MEQTLEGTAVVPSAICLASRASIAQRTKRSCAASWPHRLQGADSRRQRRADRASGRRRRRSSIVIVSGTGSIAYGRNEHGEASRAEAGDMCSATKAAATGSAGLRCARLCDMPMGAGASTSLTPRLLSALRRERAAELINKVYHDEAEPPRRSPRSAKYVQQARDEGDAVAASILNRAADELMTAATAVMTRLELADARSLRACGRHVSRGAVAMRPDGAAAAGARPSEHGDAPRGRAGARRRAPRDRGDERGRTAACLSGPTSHERPGLSDMPKMPRMPRPPPSPRNWRRNRRPFSDCRRDARRSPCTKSSRGCTSRARRIFHGRTRSTSTSSSACRRTTSAATAPSCRSICSRASTFPAATYIS